MTATAAADGLFVVAKGRKRPAPVEPLKLPESVLPVRFFETPARSNVTVTMDRMLDQETWHEIDDDASDSEPVAKKPKGLREERIEALKDKGPDPW